MVAALLTPVFFSLSIIFAGKSSKIFGGPRANAARLGVALVCLALWAHTAGAGLQGPGLRWFLLSGAVGFGMGDIALYGAITRIGPRLAILLTQCLAAPIAATAEWLWLGTHPSVAEMVCAGMILAGVALALAPDHGWEGGPRLFRTGVIFGLVSALGQGLGGVISRKALAEDSAAGWSIDGGSAAYQRIVAGVLIVWLTTWVGRRSREPSPPGAWRRGWPVVLANALCGPVIGVGCFQWALHDPRGSGPVLAIVATSPLVTMMLAYFLEGQRPKRRGVLGSVVAVAGVVLLLSVHRD